MIVQTAAFLQPTGLEMLSTHQELYTETECLGAPGVSPGTLLWGYQRRRADVLLSQPGEAGDLSDIPRGKTCLKSSGILFITWMQWLCRGMDVFNSCWEELLNSWLSRHISLTWQLQPCANWLRPPSDACAGRKGRRARILNSLFYILKKLKWFVYPFHYQSILSLSK